MANSQICIFKLITKVLFINRVTLYLMPSFCEISKAQIRRKRGSSSLRKRNSEVEAVTKLQFQPMKLSDEF